MTYDVNVLGTLHICSAAGHATYENGGGYTAATFGLTALTQTLRLELLGMPVHVTEIAPGMVKTEEFALSRFDGDPRRSAAVYAGCPTLTAHRLAAPPPGWSPRAPAKSHFSRSGLA